MSTTQKVKDTVTATIKSTEEFIESTKESLQMQLSKTVPNIQHDLDSSLEEAGRALSNALSSIENKTNSEQMHLLNAYKLFLQKQIAFVDDRVMAIKKDLNWIVLLNPDKTRRSENGSFLEFGRGSSDSVASGTTRRIWRILDKRTHSYRFNNRCLQIICRKEYTYRQVNKIPI